jgi:hypothetical protein
MSNSINALYVTLHIKNEEEKLNHAGLGLAQQNGFWPSISTEFFQSLLRLVKGPTEPNTWQRRV